MKPSRLPGRILMILVALFLYAPIFVLIAFSFNAGSSRVRFTGFSMDWYVQLFQDEAIIQSLLVSLLLAVLSSVIATVIGTVSAIGYTRMRARPRKLLLGINNIPITNPDIVTGVSLMLVFSFFFGLAERVGLVVSQGFGTLLIAHITFNVPYIILSVMPKLRQMSKHAYEAALDLGATPFTAYRRVILPEIMPGVVSGLLIAFTMSLDDFLISYFTAGQVETLPIAIYSMTRRQVSPKINALSTILFMTILLLLVLVNVVQSRDKKRVLRR